MTKEVIAFLPCRQGSERVVGKNVKPFADIEGGLTTIKITQLINCSGVDRIVISTDDPKVIAIANTLAQSSPKPIEVIERPHHLCLSSTSMDDFILYIPTIITQGIIFWVHVTEPFADEHIYNAVIESYHQNVVNGSHDSLLTVTNLQTFVWDQNGPVNYDRSVQKWPRSQDLPPMYEVNCAVFMISPQLMVAHADRVGAKPLLFPLEFPATVDIDIDNDFFMAESLWRAMNINTGKLMGGN